MGVSAMAKASDQVFERLVSGMESRFGRSAAEGLARHFIEAEGADFYWEARLRERWLGGYESLDPEAGERIDRVAVFGLLDGRYYTAVLLVDWLGGIDALLGLRQFECRADAERAFEIAR
jgi:hypothetical protein